MAIVTKPKPKGAAHRKRQAKHHKQGKHYLKTYWPYIPMLAIVSAGLLVNSLWSKPQVLGQQSDFSATSLLTDTNSQRTSQHLTGLTLDPQLTAAAQAKAQDMIQHNYWAHTSPAGKTPWSFITGAGYQYQAAGENLAYGFADADQVINGWMNSQEHRDNVLSQAYTNVGFGVAASPNFDGHGPQTIVVAEYGQPIEAVATVHFSVPTTATNTTAAVKGDKIELPAHTVSRIQLITGGKATWSLVAVSALAGAALMLFLVRHGYRLHRVLNRGEAFIAHHPYLDISIVLVITTGFVLTRTSGLIR